MFKTWKENRENKRDILFYQAFLLRTLSEIVLEFKKANDAAKKSGISEEEAVKLLNSLKGLNQKDIVDAIVNKINSNESVTNVNTDGK